MSECSQHLTGAQVRFVKKIPHFWGPHQKPGGFFDESDLSKPSVFQLEVKDVLGTVLKRRLIFVPLPEPEPLQNGDRADLPSSEPPVAPLLHQRPLLQPELLVTRGWK